MAITDIKQAMKVLEVESSDFKKSEILDLARALTNVVVNEMTQEKDKEAFLKVALLVKNLKGRLKKVTTSLDEKHKPGIKDLEEKLDEAKLSYKNAVEPFKIANKELDRIDTEARNAVTKYTTALVNAAKNVAAPAPGDEPVFMAPEADATQQGISKGGHDLNFTTKKVVRVIDINAVPANLCEWAANAPAISAVLKDLGVKNADIKVQADGLAAIKIAAMDLPEAWRKRTGIKERTVIDIGGCPGVAIEEEYRPTVK